jgi:hypothetical protein
LQSSDNDVTSAGNCNVKTTADFITQINNFCLDGGAPTDGRRRRRRRQTYGGAPIKFCRRQRHEKLGGAPASAQRGPLRKTTNYYTIYVNSFDSHSHAAYIGKKHTELRGQESRLSRDQRLFSVALHNAYRLSIHAVT